MGRGWGFELHAWNIDVKGDSKEVSDKKEEHVENWRKDNPYFQCQRTWLIYVVVFCGGKKCEW